MISEAQFQEELNRIINNALREDIGAGDYSTLACIPEKTKGKAKLIIKEAGILAGIDFAKMVFAYVDSDLSIEVYLNDGDSVGIGDIAFCVEGNTHSILKVERFVLNAIQRMSAIATKTYNFATLIATTNAKILDTRKTTPGIRALEKWAVKIGGGENHRFALYDMIMLKDNHIDFCGGVSKAIKTTKKYLKEQNLDLKIIVEARNLEEVALILEEEGIHRILLDNFNFEDTKRAVAMIGKACYTESSGGIDENNIASYAACGVDFISLGALTHSVYNLDMSLKAI